MITEDHVKNLKDFETFAGRFLYIKPKTGGSIHLFKFNKAQRFLNGKLELQRNAPSGRVRTVIVKGRQLGGSTLVQGRYFHRVVTNRGVKAFILAHRRDATANIFRMTNRFYIKLPDGLIR